MLIKKILNKAKLRLNRKKEDNLTQQKPSCNKLKMQKEDTEPNVMRTKI